jgi:hypothetical protein
MVGYLLGYDANNLAWELRIGFRELNFNSLKAWKVWVYRIAKMQLVYTLIVIVNIGA